MRETKLILLEGIPGGGKSTTAHFLHRQLTRLSVPHRWCYEGERGHPVYTFTDAASLNQLVDDVFSGRHQEVIDVTLAQWRALSASLVQSSEVVLMDGILYGHLTWTLLAADVPRDAIVAYVAEAERLIQPCSPSLVYFRPHDVHGAMTRITTRRGERWAESHTRSVEQYPYCKHRGLRGFDGLVRFWEDYSELMDTRFEAGKLAALRVRNDTADWQAYLRQVSDFLNLPPAVEDEPAPSVSERFAGTYTFTHRGEQRECEVSYFAGILYLTGVTEIWPQTRLIPLGDAHFAAESFPFEFAFVEDAGGVQEMRASGPDFVWGGIPSVYVKQ